MQPNFAKRGGVIPVVAQDAQTGQILMLAYINLLAFQMTLTTGLAHYWSSSDPQRQPWLKGSSSGNTQRVVKILVDCDGDAVVYLVEPAGPACHTNQTTCFYRDVLEDVSQAALPTEKEQLPVVDIAVAASLLQKGV